MKSKNPERIHPQEQMLNRENIEQQRLKEKQTDKIVGGGRYLATLTFHILVKTLLIN